MGSAGSLSTSSSLSGGITRDVAAAAHGFAQWRAASAIAAKVGAERNQEALQGVRRKR